jgi:hypothetical protein
LFENDTLSIALLFEAGFLNQLWELSGIESANESTDHPWRKDALTCVPLIPNDPPVDLAIQLGCSFEIDGDRTSFHSPLITSDPLGLQGRGYKQVATSQLGQGLSDFDSIGSRLGGFHVEVSF